MHFSLSYLMEFYFCLFRVPALLSDTYLNLFLFRDPPNTYLPGTEKKISNGNHHPESPPARVTDGNFFFCFLLFVALVAAVGLVDTSCDAGLGIENRSTEENNHTMPRNTFQTVRQATITLRKSAQPLAHRLFKSGGAPGTSGF